MSINWLTEEAQVTLNKQKAFLKKGYDIYIESKKGDNLTKEEICIIFKQHGPKISDEDIVRGAVWDETLIIETVNWYRRTDKITDFEHRLMNILWLSEVI